MTGEEFTKLMRDANFTQIKVSRLFGISTRQVRRYQDGEAEVPQQTQLLLLVFAFINSLKKRFGV